MQKFFLNILRICFFLIFTAILSIIGCHSSSIRNSLPIFSAGGIYKILNQGDAAASLLAVSTDGAQNWSYQIPTSFLPPDYQSGATEYNYLYIPTSSCYRFICVLAGSYLNSSGGRSPLLVVSTDGGSTWTYKLSSFNVPADAGTAAQQNIGLATASCNKDVCIAAGSYHNAAGLVSYPLLAVSKDGGNTWTYKITSANLPNDFDTNGTLITTSCSDEICTAAGYFKGA